MPGAGVVHSIKSSGLRNGGFRALRDHLSSLACVRETETATAPSERVIIDIRLATRRQHSAQEEIHIILYRPHREVCIVEHGAAAKNPGPWRIRVHHFSYSSSREAS
jgi:hypothetical protein